MPTEKEPTANPPRRSELLGRLSTGLFVTLADGSVIRRPTTMLRPPTFRESMLGRPATTSDIIGMETVLREADELRELRKRYSQDDIE